MKNFEQEIQEEELPAEEDYLFTRKADKYMFIILAEDGSFSFIQETNKGPDKGAHWGEMRVCREAMYIIGIKLMTTAASFDTNANPFTDSVLATITEEVANAFEDASMIAVELTNIDEKN